MASKSSSPSSRPSREECYGRARARVHQAVARDRRRVHQKPLETRIVFSVFDAKTPYTHEVVPSTVSSPRVTPRARPVDARRDRRPPRASTPAMASSPTRAAMDAEAMDAEERHARAVARQLARQLEARRDALNSTTTTTTDAAAKTRPRPRDARDALASNDENASRARAADAKAMDALRGRCARLERERDEARRSRADLARKCERLLGRAKTQDVELHKLRRMLGTTTTATTRAARGAARRSAPAATRGDGSPEVVSFEYHVASIAAFERKVESLIEEIERLRAADARRAREADARDRAALETATAEDDFERASPSPPPSPSSPSSPTRVPSRAYSPTLSPLDALLSRITVTERDMTSRRDLGDSDDFRRAKSAR